MSSESSANKWISAFLAPRVQDGTDPSLLRASDADRERVLAVLAEAVTDGRLTPLEHEERVDQACAARTLGELAALTADLLPPESQPFRVDNRPVTAFFRSESRTGRWVVPSQVPVTSLGGKVTMDLCEALLQSRRVVVQLAVMAGTVTLVVPEGVRIVTAPSARVRTVRNEVRLPPGATGHAPDAPVIELAGFVVGGKVVARSPKRPRRGLFRRG
ncbi:DUF1707 SHOCT-like domain-containing protein [Microbispora sp. ATCC PTA-5024]|uniref:DUF1707 SHOCT-like domain-containing protein n=1 Tax=Microbispora sp. ATCC PTA-5024 TaxID=316330 RepID=UPI0003DDD0DC|nr:DUF1707 domain-containing protein [Microbispora sp. ATCC PTA-5024]ETK31074.1 hypothetical protein MPTA5024_36735 [Microbispora sp. ATCC PTA-5024]